LEEILKKCLPTYEISEKIGQGVYGSVFRVRDRFKERAVKIVPIVVARSLSCRSTSELDAKVSHDFHAVETYYEKIRGPGVVDVYDFFLVNKQVSAKQARAYLVILMQYCPENLHDYVIDRHPVSPARAGSLMASLAAVLQRLSTAVEDVFVLTDLKPSNLLVGLQGEMLIGDLGGLKRIGSVTTAANAQFTLNWCAPEFILQGARPDIQAAIFSFGLVSYFIWEGRLPEEEGDFVERVRKLKERGASFGRDDMPAHIQQLIIRCLAHDPGARPAGFAAVSAALSGVSEGRTAAGECFPAGRPVPLSDTVSNRPDETTRAGPVCRPEPVPGTVWREPATGIRFVWVPGGSFFPGDPALPRETVARTRVEGFWMAKYPVTQGEWARIMGTRPSHFSGGANLPVEQVSFNDAVDFVCRLIRTSRGKCRFALPSEEQWEFAARSGGKAEVFAGGDLIGPVAWYEENSGYTTHPVGQRRPNGLGLFDMSGNVMEWCGDGRMPNVDGPQPGTSVYDDVGVQRPVRGGSWSAATEACRTWARRLVTQRLGYSTLGLRIARLA
jgi:formylglycine-generating enzyme required for sulfatase activity